MATIVLGSPLARRRAWRCTLGRIVVLVDAVEVVEVVDVVDVVEVVDAIAWRCTMGIKYCCCCKCC